MAALSRVYITRKNDLQFIPELYITYPIVYIQDDDYAYDIGGERGSKYFILDTDGKLYGQIYGFIDLNEQLRLTDIDSHISNELRTSLELLPQYKVVKVGQFESKKIVFYGKNTIKFNIHGLCQLYNLYTTDEDTMRIQHIY
jgi:hypothetical protein